MIERELTEPSVQNDDDWLIGDNLINATQSALTAHDTPFSNGELVTASTASESSDRSRKRARVSPKARKSLYSPSLTERHAFQ